ncbi:MAG: DUF1579 domain-containing protein [Planctomycetota bacterium]|nr:MAG: DUF1579 domain-containing protein [Planctomycetota bacterium]
MTSCFILAAGCMPKLDMETLKQMRPQRPAALSRLDAFVGNWQSESEMRMGGLDEVIRGSGTSEIRWAGDGWFLVERAKWTMGEMGDMEAMGIWAYDAKGKKYRTFWVDTMGGTGVGTARYNEKTKTWHLKAKIRTPFGDSIGKGTTRFPDADTMEWTWREYALGGLMKVSEMKGTSKRRP